MPWRELLFRQRIGVTERRVEHDFAAMRDRDGTARLPGEPHLKGKPLLHIVQRWREPRSIFRHPSLAKSLRDPSGPATIGKDGQTPATPARASV